MNKFLCDYLLAALFTSYDDGGNNLDSHYSLRDFSPAAIGKATEDGKKFEADNVFDLTGQIRNVPVIVFNARILTFIKLI